MRYLIFINQLNIDVCIKFIVLSVEKIMDDSSEPIQSLFTTLNKCRNKVMYSTSLQKCGTKDTPTKLKKKINLLQKKS